MHAHVDLQLDVGPGISSGYIFCLCFLPSTSDPALCFRFKNEVFYSALFWFFVVFQRPPYQGVQRKDMPPVAPRRRPFRPHFMHLYRLVLARSRCPQLPKANHFLVHLALLVGPEALSRPATAQKSLGRGRSPPCAPPCAATRRPGWATPSPKPPRGGV
jgi:hypothetical protein